MSAKNPQRCRSVSPADVYSGRDQTILLERERIKLKTFTRKRGFSIEKYAENSFGVFQEGPVNVVWKFSPKAAQDASEFLFHPSQTLEPQRDGSLIVRFRPGGLLEMSWHLFTWGDQVDATKPKRLIVMFRRALEGCSAHRTKMTQPRQSYCPIFSYQSVTS